MSRQPKHGSIRENTRRWNGHRARCLLLAIVVAVEKKLEARAANFVKDNRLAGAAVGVVHGDTLAWWSGVGFADVASRRRPERTTLYRIASITKTFTGTAIMRLRDSGMLKLDDPIGVHIPEVAHLEGVTIRR